MFKFKLEPVLSLREKVEESKKKELGIASSHHEMIANQKSQLEYKKQEAIKAVQFCEQSVVDIKSMKIFNSYSVHINKAIEAKNHELDEAKKKIEEKRKELFEAVKERKILDNLKDIHRESFMEEEKQEQQRILDDIVTYKYGRKGRSDNT